MKTKGLYFHVPFCVTKCAYCDFYSISASPEAIKEYSQALLQELKLKGKLWGGNVDTIYFGGGTPSCLNPEIIAAALKECGRYFTWEENAEMTFEINPGTTSLKQVQALQALGVNRVSLGLQAVQDSLLVTLGRIHRVDDVTSAISDLKKVGITNFSVDAMYGLPGQSLKDYLQTLEFIVYSGATHVSSYALQLETNTRLYALWEQGALSIPEDDEVAEMMLAGREYLLAQGFVQYEISNYAYPGFESRHNLRYWRNQEYIGFGPSAASFLMGRRFVNVADLNRYIKLLSQDRIPVASCERLDFAAQMAETFILGLRMLGEGVNKKSFQECFGVDPVKHFAPQIAKWVNLGCLAVTGESIVLTPLAIPIASQIQLSFLP